MLLMTTPFHNGLLVSQIKDLYFTPLWFGKILTARLYQVGIDLLVAEGISKCSIDR